MFDDEAEELMDAKTNLIIDIYCSLDYMQNTRVRNYDFLEDFVMFKLPIEMQREDAGMKLIKNEFLKKKKIIEYRDLLTKINQIFIYDIALVIASYILKNPNEQIF